MPVMISPGTSTVLSGLPHLPELFRFDLALGGHNRGIQGNQGRGGVAGVHRQALVFRAENRVIAVVPGHGIAGWPAFTHAVVEAVLRFAEIPATMQLGDVAADGPHVADMRTGHSAGRLRQGGVLLLDHRVGGNIGQPGGGADLQHPAFFLDVIETGNGLDIDQGGGISRQNVVLEPANQIGAAGYDLAPPLASAAEASAKVFAFVWLKAFIVSLLLCLPQRSENLVRRSRWVDPFANGILNGTDDDMGVSH